MEPTYALVIFDLNGTLITTQSGETFPKTADDWQWLPGRLERIHALQQQDIHVAVATNQGGAAFDIIPALDLAGQIEQMMMQAGIAEFRICFHHPNGKVPELTWDCPYRKPKPGMLYDLIHTHNLLPAQTLMVGDRSEDREAAEAAGVMFQWANDFFAEA